MSANGENSKPDKGPGSNEQRNPQSSRKSPANDRLSGKSYSKSSSSRSGKNEVGQTADGPRYGEQDLPGNEGSMSGKHKPYIGPGELIDNVNKRSEASNRKYRAFKHFI